MNQNTLILVVYLAVGKMSEAQVVTYVKNCKMRVGIPDTSKDCKIFYVPIRKGDTRVECINPQVIDKKDWEAKTSKALHDMESSLDEFLEKYKPKELKKTLSKPTPPPTQIIKEGVKPKNNVKPKK